MLLQKKEIEKKWAINIKKKNRQKEIEIIRQKIWEIS